MSQSSLLIDTVPSARPFVKWAGGKGQLLAELSRHLPASFRRYHEPFVGGGALFFHLSSTGRLDNGAVLSDYNDELIVCYQVVRDSVEELIEALKEHHRHRLSAEYFMQVRSWDRQPDFNSRSKVERAARTLFLNRTCYNGLYRLNRKGQFNAPFGYYKNPQIYDADNLRAASRALHKHHVELRVEDFEAVATRAEPGDLVYFDPPYVPVSATASFTHYTGQTFDEGAQRRLAALFDSLVARGVLVMLSNSYTALADDLYARHHKSIVLASRKINCDGRKRGSIQELIVCGYPPRRNGVGPL